MTILAIDPGPEASGYLYLKPSYNYQVLESGELVNSELNKLLTHAPAEVLCVEMVESFGMPVGRSVFETVYWIGRFIEHFSYTHPEGKFIRIGRQQVKLHNCRSVKAKDSNIRQALIDRFGPPGTKKAPGRTYGISGHGWSALALAVTCFDQYFEAQGGGLKL